MSASTGKHIMFSYAWEGGHKKVDQIANRCKAAGIPIWMDTRNGLGPNLIDGMAEAVEESLAVCCFITPEYQESKYCKMELEYADKLDKTIIPCFLTDFQPRKWVGLLTAGLIHYNFFNDASDIVANQLIQHVKQHILKRKPRVPSKPDPVPVTIKSQSSPSASDYGQKFAVGKCDSNAEEPIPQYCPIPVISPRKIDSTFPKKSPTKISNYIDFFDNKALPIIKTGKPLISNTTAQQNSTNDVGRLLQDYKDYL